MSETMLCSFFWYGSLFALSFFFFFQAEDGIRDPLVTGVQTCALPIFSATIGPFQRLTFRQYRVSHRSVISNEAPQLRETPITQITQLPSAAHPRRATGLDRAFAWGFAGCSLLMCGNRACGFAVFIIRPSGASAHKTPGLTFRFSSSAFRRSRMRFHERLERSRCRSKSLAPLAFATGRLHAWVTVPSFLPTTQPYGDRR